ncbi:MAG: right-handed parallel beta-helix repeat-containing protein, partial [Mycobacterium sp.]|nr:right-handed parallel beta-helix repeat-containing protein [Mycobacterium sp.]
DIPQTQGVTTTIPLYYMPEYYSPGGGAQVQVKYGIDVAIGDNDPRTFVFDTGGNGFFAGYDPTYWEGVAPGTDPIKMVYTSGNYYDAVITEAPVTIGPSGGPTVTTGQPVQIGAILSGGKGNQVFDFTNPYAPPVDGRFAGDFGAAFGLQPSVSGDASITSVLFQLPGNLSSGFLVQLGPIGTDPTLTVGITDALRAQFPYAIPVSPLPGAGTYPVSGYQVLTQFGFAAQYSVQETGGQPQVLGTQTFPQCAAQCLPSLIDSGAPSTSVRLPGAPQPFPLESDGGLKPGATFVATFPTTQGRPPLTWSFVAGNNGSVNQVGYDDISGAATNTQNVNTGLNLYNGYDAMFDVQNQIIWLRPNGGQSTLSLQAVSTTGDQTYEQNVQLAGGSYTSLNGNFSVGGVTELAADTTVQAGGDVTFSGTVDGAHALDVRSPGTSRFVRGVGQLNPLTGLTTDGGGATLTAGVTTAGSQTYGDDLTLNGLYNAVGGNVSVVGAAELAGPVTVQASGAQPNTGNITFDSTIDAEWPQVGFTLGLTTNGGQTNLEGPVGDTNPLGGLILANGTPNASQSTVTAGRRVNLNGSLANAGSTGILIGDNVRVTLTGGGTVTDFAASGIVFAGRSTKSTISNFDISDNVYDGIQFAVGTDLGGTVIDSNNIYGNGASGIETLAPVSKLQITENTIGKPGQANPWNYVSDGPNVHGIVLAPGGYDEMSISGNTIQHNFRSGIFAPGGVTGVEIDRNQLTGNGLHGIELADGDFADTVISGNVVAGNKSDGIALGAGIGQGATTGNPIDGYAGDGHYVLSYANNPDFYGPTLPADPQIAMEIGSKTVLVNLDTGSRGLYFDQYQLDPDILPPPGEEPRYGHIYLNSSNRLYFGRWVDTDITFRDSAYVDSAGTQAGTKATANIPVLVVQAVGASNTPAPGQSSAVTTFGTTVSEGTITITNGVQTLQAPIVANPPGSPGKGTVTIPGGFWATFDGANACTDPSCTSPSKLAPVANFGVGFDRSGQGTAPTTDGINQGYNAFLNLTEMRDGRMRPGYVMGADGVTLGLDASIPPFAYTNLSPTGLTQGQQTAPDWQPGTGTLAIKNTTYGSGQVVLDMGYDGGILTLPNLPGGLPADGTLTVNLLNSTGAVRYDVTPADGRKNLMNPSAISVFNPLGGGFTENAPPLSQQFFNTGRNAFAGLNYLFDAAGGYLGLAVGTSTDAQAAFESAGGQLTVDYYPNPTAPTGVTNVEIRDNTISGNEGAGVLVNGPASNRNAILDNAIYSNNGAGIVLTGGANDGQAAPQAVSARKVDDTVVVTGDLVPEPGYSGGFTVQVFASPAGQSGGTGGRYYLGEFPVESAGSFLQSVPAGPAAPGDVITMTATPTTRNTSPFSTPAVIS